MAKNKDYLTLANERHQERQETQKHRNKIDQQKNLIEWAKIHQKEKAEQNRTKNKIITALIAVIATPLTIIILMVICYTFIGKA